jgi:hypothetical protein
MNLFAMPATAPTRRRDPPHSSGLTRQGNTVKKLLEPLLLVAALAMLHLLNPMAARKSRFQRVRALDAPDTARWEDEGGAPAAPGRSTAVASP